MNRYPRTTARRTVIVDDRRTSVSLEAEFWVALEDIAYRQGRSVSAIVTEVEYRRLNGNLSSAVRLYILAHYRRSANGLDRRP